ncbi:MAG: TIGR00730 family Rossman fold protein [Prevotella sp.]|nr:TIGR00730 family Rossman fold protein [Prevotella sp.]
MNIGIFCSANNSIEPVYFEKTAELGRWMGHNGHTLVFGGCNMGLMECVAKAVHEAGGHTIGVVPRIIEEGGRTSHYVDEQVNCENLSDRKELLLQHSDVVVALPGGIGTLDEVFTVAASHTIGYHQKPILLYNINGFWDSLIALLNDLSERGMVRGRWRDYILTASTLEELVAFFK